MKNILLTGGSGFIGRNIKEQLGDKYNIFDPSSKELDVLDKKSLDKFIEKNKISSIIHTAVYNRERRNLNSDLDLDSNLRMFFNLVDISKNLEKLIYFGSGAEFDKRFTIKNISEKQFGTRIPLLNDYSLSKYIMNLEAINSNNIYNLRLFGVYGKYEDYINCFPSHLCISAIKSQNLVIRQDCIFDFLYVNDIMKPLQYILNNKPKYKDYNICSSNPVSLYDMAKIVNEISNNELEIKILKEGYNLEYTANNERIKKECDFKVTDIKKGLEELYNYYLENRAFFNIGC